MIRGSARWNTEVIRLVALAQECLSDQDSQERKALWGDWARLSGSSHKPSTESYSSPLGSLASPPQLTSESWGFVYLACCAVQGEMSSSPHSFLNTYVRGRTDPVPRRMQHLGNRDRDTRIPTSSLELTYPGLHEILLSHNENYHR